MQSDCQAITGPILLPTSAQGHFFLGIIGEFIRPAPFENKLLVHLSRDCSCGEALRLVVDNSQRFLEYGAGTLPFQKETEMADLTKEEVMALGHAVGLEIQDPELTEVTHSLNALLEALNEINPAGLNAIEPLPIILPPA
jgi:hypothetical protein